MGWGIRSLLLGSLAAAGLATSGALSDVGFFDFPDFIVGRNGKSRNHGHTAGCAAHRRWKKARASGRHDFRRTLRHG